MARSRLHFTSKRRRAPTVGEIATALDGIAPPAMAQGWDNVGLLVGDRRGGVQRVLLCVDLTAAVLAEAVQAGAEMIVAYHPPIFRPIARLLADGTGMEAVVHRAIALGIALYSPHTALDAADGGTNDVIAAMCGLTAVEPFEYLPAGLAPSSPPSEEGAGGASPSLEGGVRGGPPRSSARLKLVTFVPETHLEKVAAAMFAAGAGRIGDYEQCSFRVRGEGTFFGTEATSPKVGQKGRLERVPETRLEVITPALRLPEVIEALRGSHPYEEPAFDIYPLAAGPVRGIGRVGALPPGTTLRGLAQRLRRATGSKILMTVGDAGMKVKRAAVCVGAAGRLPLERPRSADADVIVTGEIRHHDALTILRAGKCAVALGHWESERPVLPVLAKQLAGRLPTVTFTVSRQDEGPFSMPS